jgi:hypothetical protein
VAGRFGAAGQIELVAPDDLAAHVVFANDPVPFVTNEIIPTGELTDHPRVPVRIGMIGLQGDLLDDFAIASDFHNPPIAAFGDHR